jgi:hypothetical protein
MRYRWQLVFFVLWFCGCGSSSSFQDSSGQPAGSNVPVSVSASLTAAEGGQLLHPAGHGTSIAAGSLSADSLVTLSLLEASSLSVRNSRDFSPVGQALRLDLVPGVSLSGQTTFTVPFVTEQPERFGVYWHLGQGLVVPLEAIYSAQNGAFQATLDLTNEGLSLQALTNARSSTTSVTVSVVDESGWFSRPAHVPWPSYNMYVYRDGTFEKIVDQGVPSEAIPEPGSSPLMVVHGLGSNIARFDDTGDWLDEQGVFTQIYGFEYDTLSGLVSSGQKLQTAYTSIPATSEWAHLAHSMGTLVSRVAFESGQAAPYTHNSVAFAAGPHLGASVINVLQGDLGLFDRFVRYMVVNEVLDFTNADGTPCQVNIQDAGFTDLAQGSAALGALNTGAADHHPEETYRTFGGNDPGLEYDTADFLLGVYPDDGLVFLSSANPGSLIGAVQATVVPESHSSIVTDTEDSLPEILDALLQSN